MNIRNLTTILLLSGSVSIGACSGDGNPDDVLAQDTSLTRDLALANEDTTSEPQLADVPVSAEPKAAEAEPELTPAPRASRPQVPRARVVTAPARTAVRPPASRPRPAPAVDDAPVDGTVTASGNTVSSGARGSERPLGVVVAGSEFTLTSGQRICTNTNRVGDRFTAQLAEPVMGDNGAVIPVGATLVGEVSTLSRSDGAGDNIEIGLRVESVAFGGKTYPISTEVTYAQVDKVRAESRGDDVKKVATGAAIGAVLGQIFGGKTKSTVIGAAGGAAAGAVMAGRNANYNGCVPDGGKITVRLTRPLTIQVT